MIIKFNNDSAFKVNLSLDLMGAFQPRGQYIKNALEQYIDLQM